MNRLETENEMEMKREVEDRKLHRMGNVHDVLEMWQGSQNLSLTHKQSGAQNNRFTATRYISDTEEIVKESWSKLQHDDVAVFKLSERVPVPPALAAKDLCTGQTEVLNVCHSKRVDHHPAKSDEDSAPEGISNSENWLDWNGDLDNPNVS